MAVETRTNRVKAFAAAVSEDEFESGEEENEQTTLPKNSGRASRRGNLYRNASKRKRNEAPTYTEEEEEDEEDVPAKVMPFSHEQRAFPSCLYPQR